MEQEEKKRKKASSTEEIVTTKKAGGTKKTTSSPKPSSEEKIETKKATTAKKTSTTKKATSTKKVAGLEETAGTKKASTTKKAVAKKQVVNTKEEGVAKKATATKSANTTKAMNTKSQNTAKATNTQKLNAMKETSGTRKVTTVERASTTKKTNEDKKTSSSNKPISRNKSVTEKTKEDIKQVVNRANKNIPEKIEIHKKNELQDKSIRKKEPFLENNNEKKIEDHAKRIRERRKERKAKVKEEKKEGKKVKKELDKKGKIEKKAKNNNEDKEQVETKHIDISLGKIIAVIIIIGLIVLNVNLGIQAGNIIKGKDDIENNNINTETQKEKSKTSKEIGHVIDVEDEIVSNIIDKIIFEPNATASMYQEGTFNIETITNDLKLRLGWSKVKYENKVRSKEDDETIVEVEATIMDESIKNIFGPEVVYQRKAFENTDVNIFSAYCKVLGEIKYVSGLYRGTEIEDEKEQMVPLIYQEVQEVVQYSDKIEVYVKTAFVDVKNENYILYRNFDSNFYGKLSEISAEELFVDTTFNKDTGEGAISTGINTNLDSIREQLNTYKYTFALDNNTGEYFLSEFIKDKNQIKVDM